MKKLLAILVLSLLVCNNSFADAKHFNISCKGEIDITTPFTQITETSYYFEDFEVLTYDNKIMSLERLSTNNHMMRLHLFENTYNKNMVVIGNKAIQITSPELSRDVDYGKLTLKEFSGEISLVSGNYSGRAIIRVSETKHGAADSFYIFNSVCTGTEELYAYLNKKDKQKSPTEDDDKVVAAASGSGFFVTKAGHLVTNHHVIEGCNAIKVNFKGKETQAEIIAVDKSNDLAIIKAKINPSKVFPVSNEDVSLLQDIIIAGFPLGKKVSSAIKIHKGSVTALAGYNDNYSNFQTDATINQGNSGGPIMNQKGNILGVAVATWVQEGVQGIHFGIKSSTLKTFAKANAIKFLPPNYREMSNADLGKLITEGTVFLECWMTVAKIKQMISQAENTKAFYSEHK